MKKFIALLIVLTLTSCVRDEDFIIEPVTEVPEALEIDDLVGIKLESSIDSERVAMNVKLPEEGVYRIKF